MSSSVAALMEQLKDRVGGEDVTEGWGGIEGLTDEDFAARQLAAQLDHATLYRQLFASETGVYVLEDLIRKYLRQRIVQPHDTDFAAGIRQGQADVVQWILYLIEFANKGGRVLPEPKE